MKIQKLPTLEEQNKAIREECKELADFLVAKNTAYGGQALAPVAILSKGDPLDIIFARIDDKLSRIMRGESAGEDPWADLRGYITLWKVRDRLAKQGYYQTQELSTPGNNSSMPMPIDQRVVLPSGAFASKLSEDANLELSELGDIDTPSMEISPEQDPIDMAVQDIEALAAQEITSLTPDVPDKYQEKKDSKPGIKLAAMDDPLKAFKKPTERKPSNGDSSF